jgi:hypothetical protein
VGTQAREQENSVQNFAIIISVIDSWIKRGFYIWDFFDKLPDLAPE